MAKAYDSYYNDYHKNAELQQNLKYKTKYRKLKRIVKNTVFVSLDKCNFDTYMTLISLYLLLNIIAI